MRRAISFLVGVVSGAMVGAAVAILLAPSSGQELQSQMRGRVQELIEEGRRAAAARRAELEDQLEAFKRGAPVVIESTGGQPKP
jgi:gas vesicle protein